MLAILRRCFEHSLKVIDEKYLPVLQITATVEVKHLQSTNIFHLLLLPPQDPSPSAFWGSF